MQLALHLASPASTPTTAFRGPLASLYAREDASADSTPAPCTPLPCHFTPVSFTSTPSTFYDSSGTFYDSAASEGFTSSDEEENKERQGRQAEVRAHAIASPARRLIHLFETDSDAGMPERMLSGTSATSADIFPANGARKPDHNLAGWLTAVMVIILTAWFAKQHPPVLHCLLA